MKYYFYIVIIQILTTSCSAQKAEYDVVNDFLNSELDGFQYDSIHVRVQPLDDFEMVELYEKAYKERNNQNSDLSTVWISPELNEWPFNEEEINDLKKNLKANVKEWEKTDFRNKNFVFKTADIVEDMDFRVSHLGKGTKEYVLRVSHPVFDNKKTYALFKFYFTELFFGGSPAKNRGTVVMKKINNKWVVLSSIREAVYE